MPDPWEWQARRESNPQPAVLETAALPIELLAYSGILDPLSPVLYPRSSIPNPQSPIPCPRSLILNPRSPILYPAYSMIFATTPAPTVRPPSRIAKRSPSSIAIGAISVTVIPMLSPGITISVPAGSSTLPVTSVVRK